MSSRRTSPKTDFRPILAGSNRVLVFWDAHGADVAQAVFERLLPELPPANQIVVDDIWSTPEKYGLRAEYQAGPLWSLFDELPPLWEYLSAARDRLRFRRPVDRLYSAGRERSVGAPLALEDR